MNSDEFWERHSKALQKLKKYLQYLSDRTGFFQSKPKNAALGIKELEGLMTDCVLESDFASAALIALEISRISEPQTNVLKAGRYFFKAEEMVRKWEKDVGPLPAEGSFLKSEEYLIDAERCFQLLMDARVKEDKDNTNLYSECGYWFVKFQKYNKAINYFTKSLNGNYPDLLQFEWMNQIFHCYIYLNEYICAMEMLLKMISYQHKKEWIINYKLLVLLQDQSPDETLLNEGNEEVDLLLETVHWAIKNRDVNMLLFVSPKVWIHLTALQQHLLMKCTNIIS